MKHPRLSDSRRNPPSGSTSGLQTHPHRQSATVENSGALPTRPDRFVAAYIAGLGLVAVRFANASASPTIEATRTQVPKAKRVAQSSARASAFLWCLKASHAELLAEAWRAEVEVSPAPIATDELLDLARATAARLGIPVASEAEVAANARAAVAKIEREFSNLQRTGGLKAINQAFRRKRLAAAVEGRQIRYAAFIAREKLRMIRTMAACAVQADRLGFGALPLSRTTKCGQHTPRRRQTTSGTR